MSPSVSEQKPPLTVLQQFDASAVNYEANAAGSTAELTENILPKLPKLTPDSIVLDNACGTGLATDCLLRFLGDGIKPTIHAVDGAPNMVDITRQRFEAYDNVHVEVAPGEDLSVFADNFFSHSLTIMGLFFFADAPKGARELFRTLAPGGTAVVTGWTELGALETIQTVQKAIRPGEKLFQLPVAKEWFDPRHMKTVLSDAGFTKVEMSQITVHWSANDSQELMELLMARLAIPSMKEWTDEEKSKAEKLLPDAMKPKCEEFTRSDGTTAVGLKMVAHVAWCKK